MAASISPTASTQHYLLCKLKSSENNFSDSPNIVSQKKPSVGWETDIHKATLLEGKVEKPTLDKP